MFLQLGNILKLKWLIFKRSLREVPVVYIVLLAAILLILIYLLLKIDVEVGVKSLSIAGVIQLFFCRQLSPGAALRLLLNQYPGLSACYRLIHYVFISFLFLFLGVAFWLMALAVSLLYALADGRFSRSAARGRPAFPSPFFVRGSYMWHSGHRFFLPAIWGGIVVLEIIAYRAENFELGIVAMGGGAFPAFLITILQYEKIDFLRMYESASRFMSRTLRETFANTAIFIFLPSLLMFCLFPGEWVITLAVTALLFLLNTHLLWVKYLFYPSEVLCGVMFFIGLFLQWVMVVSVYGVVLLPLYYYFLYRQCKSNVHCLLPDYERSGY